MICVAQTASGIFGSYVYISFPKMMGSSAILRSIQYVKFKYGDFQKASRISLREPSISIKLWIIKFITHYRLDGLSRSFSRDTFYGCDPRVDFKILYSENL